MLFKSTVLAQASGSVAGATFSRNRGGLYVRSRSIPTNTDSEAQRGIRNAMTALIGRWRSVLTPAQRNGWSDYAESVPVVNKLGDTVTRSGPNMYMRSNVSRLQAGLPPVDTRPGFNNFGTIGGLELGLAVADDQEAVLVWTGTQEWAGETGSALLVYVSRPVDVSVNWFRGPYRLAATLLGNTGSPITSPQDIPLPFFVSAGSTIRAYARVTRADGRLSPAFTFPPVLVAAT